MIAQLLGTSDASFRIPFGGVLVDLCACFLILPIPLCAIDLPLSLVADLVVLIDDATDDRWPPRTDPVVVYPTPGAPRVREVLDCFVPAAEVTSAVVASAPLRLVAASPARGPRGREPAALSGRGEALLAAWAGFESQRSVLHRRVEEPLARRWRVAPTGGRTVALALDQAADRGLVVDERGGAWLVERNLPRAWGRRAPLLGAPRGADVVAALSPGATRAAAAGGEGGVTLWDLGQLGRPGPEALPGAALGALRDRMTALAFDGEQALVAGTATGDVLRVDLSAPGWPELFGREEGAILVVACRGALVGWGGVAGGVTVRRGRADPVWLPVPPAPAWSGGEPTPPAVVALSFADDGTSVWVGADDGTARRLEVTSGRELDRIDLRGLDDAPLRVLALADGEVVLLTERGALLGFARDRPAAGER